MKKILRHSVRLTRWAIACSLIFLSVLLLSARTLSLYIEDYASDIVSQLSSVLGVPVEVDKVSAEWHGLGPSVYMTGLRLGQGENLSRISSLVVKPDVVSSLLSWGIVWSRFEATEMEVALQELPSGRWSFAGIELGGGGRGGTYLEEMILESNRVAVQEARFHVRSLLGSHVELNVRDLSLDYALGFRRLSLDADFGDNLNQMQLIAELTGTGSRLLDLDGLAYLKIDAQDVSDLAQTVKDEFWSGVEISADDIPSASVELWANFRSGKHIEWQGTAVLSHLSSEMLGYESGSMRLLADLTGVYSAGAQWLNLQNAEIELYPDTVALPDLRVKRVLGVNEVNYSVILPPVQMEPLLDSLASLPVYANSSLSTLRETLNPTGEIGPLNLDMPNLDARRWQLSGHVKGLNINSYRNAPAVQNLSGAFVLDARQGRIQVDAENMAMLYPGVYDDWLKHERVQGLVSWDLDLDAQHLYVYGDSLAVLGEQGLVKGGFRVDVPLKHHPTGVDLTLFLGLENSQAKHKATLVPQPLPESLTRWLDSAIVSAEVPAAGFIYRGSTKRGQSAHRTTQLRVKTEGTELHYLDRWPQVTGLDAQVWVSDGRVVGSAQRGGLPGLDLSGIRAQVIQNDLGASILSLEAQASGDSGALLDLVRKTSLRDQVDDSLDGLELQGRTHSSVALSLPLRKRLSQEDIQIEVTTKVERNQLHLLDQDIQLEALTGTLTYDENGLAAKGLSATIWQRPFSLSIQEDQSAEILSIGLQGNLDVTDVVHWLDIDFMDRLSGETGVIGNISIATDGSEESQYQFSSDMLGVTSEFPAPLGKPADKVAPLYVEVTAKDFLVTSVKWDVLEGNHPALLSESSELMLELTQYRDREEASQAKRRSFHSARLSFQSPLPDRQQGVFAGEIRLADLDIDKCYNLYQEEMASYAAERGGDSRYGSLLGLQPMFSVLTDSLHYEGRDLGKIQLSLSSEPGIWKLGAEADYASGSYQIFEPSADETPLPLLVVDSVDINMLQHVFADGNVGEDTPFDPRDVPPMKLSVESVVVDGKDRGHWAGTLEPSRNGIWVGDLSGGFRSAALADEEGGSVLFWGVDEGGQQFTELDLTFGYEDVGDLFRLMNIEPPMDSDRGVFYASLNWDSAPQDYSLASVNGIMGINASNGTFHTSDTNVPNTLLKTIGLINVGSWVRRLRLDFNDMASSGTPYDQIIGDFLIGNQQLSTLTPVDIELSSGSMLFDGLIDLAKEEVDAKLVVTLPARQNVTWVAALVAGLPAAAGVWLAGKVFDDELDSLSSVSYRVEGSLDDLSVSAEKMFESTITK